MNFHNKDKSISIDCYEYKGGDEDQVKARLRLGETVIANIDNQLYGIQILPNFDTAIRERFLFNCTEQSIIITPVKNNKLAGFYMIKSENQVIFK